jgi:hypothetical protein
VSSKKIKDFNLFGIEIHSNLPNPYGLRAKQINSKFVGGRKKNSAIIETTVFEEKPSPISLHFFSHRRLS